MDPVAAQDILSAATAGATTVLAGVLYALFFALSRLTRKAAWMWPAYLAYGLLAVSVAILAETLHLDGFWRYLIGALLIGYLLAPRAIWKLCVGTHAGESDAPLRPPLVHEETRS